MTGWIVIVSRGEISLRWKEMEKERKREVSVLGRWKAVGRADGGTFMSL